MVAVHDPIGDELQSKVEIELVAGSSTDPELLLHRYISRDGERLVKVPTHHSQRSARVVSKVDEKDTHSLSEKDSASSSGRANADEENAPTLIDFEEGDPEDPRNLSPFRKNLITVTIILSLLNSTFASSITSGLSRAIREQWGVASIMTGLLVSLYMVGYVLGPLCYAPMSEHIGRRPVLVAAFTFYFIFSVACPVAPNIGSLLAFRFLQGLFATCPIAVSGGVFADIYADPIKRGRAVALFCGSTIMGALSAPFISGFIAASHMGWRFAFWVNAIFAGCVLAILVFSVPETFRPVLLQKRAKKLRSQGQNVVSAYELEDKDFKSFVVHVLLRPVIMLYKEPIVAAICVYIGMMYGLLYMFFLAYPIIFQELRGLSPGKGGLMLLPIGLGAICVTIAHYLYDIHIQKLRKNKVQVTLEQDRLFITMFSGWFIPVGLFWLAWTSYPSVPDEVVMLGGIFFGVGFTSLFIGFLNYVTDCYKIYAASAHGIMSVTRSLIAASFPLFAPAMYHHMGVHWATSLWAFVALFLAPVTVVFYKFGPEIRAHSEFASALLAQDL
ncbi:major facilitator superfamily domain-containing protein [Myxozyma melibiosi]|uniref:Major facilitator superfamily domain-containing protein n=1 Tax=Myxozyma melibiosi TaxID=54550 RepID=A0ABR1F235_9ASCO